jgi:hypothetical protein
MLMLQRNDTKNPRGGSMWRKFISIKLASMFITVNLEQYPLISIQIDKYMYPMQFTANNIIFIANCL